MIVEDGLSITLPSCTQKRTISERSPSSVPSVVRNCVTTVMGFNVSTSNSEPRPKNFLLPILYGLISQPSLSQTPSYRSSLSLSPHSVPSHLSCPVMSQG